MNWILDIFFPNRCWNCKKTMRSEFLLCCSCEKLIPFYENIHHKSGEIFDFLKLKFPFTFLYVLMKFEDNSLSQKLIHQLKYNKLEFFGEKIAQYCIDKLDFEQELNQKPDLITYVPLHKKKQKHRGFNQNHLIAKKLSNYYNIDLDSEILVRHKHSSAQAKKNRTQRLSSESVFLLNKTPSCKHILLIDDVCTTGKTLSNCVWELLKIENIKISILIVSKD